MGNDLSRNSDIESLRESFRVHGQDHVFRFWDILDASAQARLCDQARAIDLASLERARAAIAVGEAASESELAPVEVARTPEHGGDAAAMHAARQRGDALLAAGRVGLMVVAGGQGTRLGFDGPKGAFPIGPASDRSLFEIQAQKIRGLRRRYSRSLPWYVMTSPATDAATRDFFERRGHFGIPREDVFFFQQGTVPSIDFDGRLFLEQPSRIFENPNGHGGVSHRPIGLGSAR